MAIQKTEVFVLKTQPFRSSSLIVTFFSRSFGKLRGVVKGVRRERELRGAFYELFTRLEIIFYEKTRSDLHLVSEASILDSHDGLRTRLDTIAYASYFSELVDCLCEVHDPHEKIFDLLEFSFRFLPSVPEERLSRLFEIRLLHEIGWLPYLERCLSCHTPVPERGFFSVRQGAIFCALCARNCTDARPLGAEALSVLRYYADHELDMSLKRHVGTQTERELKALMEQFFDFRLGAPLKTRSFMRQIQPVLKNT
jgi:DNA repair protein RecO (recombination protein O)